MKKMWPTGYNVGFVHCSLVLLRINQLLLRLKWNGIRATKMKGNNF